MSLCSANGEICRLAIQCIANIAVNPEVVGTLISTQLPEVILDAMERHLHDGKVQYGTACVVRLSNGDF